MKLLQPRFGANLACLLEEAGPVGVETPFQSFRNFWRKRMQNKNFCAQAFARIDRSVSKQPMKLPQPGFVADAPRPLENVLPHKRRNSSPRFSKQ